MALVQNAASEETVLSEYEKLRLEKIKRNEDRMEKLGLLKSRDALAASVKKKKAKTKKTSQVSPELPLRRSSRKRKNVIDYYSQPMFEDDEEKTKAGGCNSDDGARSNDDENEDYHEASGDEDSYDDGQMVEDPPNKQPRLAHSTSTPLLAPKSKAKKTAVDHSFDCVNSTGGLTLECAKTGRSTCRKCKSKIEMGAPRVGMVAWIVGRSAITWQRPQCLLQNMCCLYSTGANGKCKASNVPFAKNQLKIGIRSHTATSYYCMESIGGILSNIVSLMRTEDGFKDFKLTAKDIDGHEKLSKKDCDELQLVLETAFQAQNGQECRLVPEDSESVSRSTPSVKQDLQGKVKSNTQEASKGHQPRSGVKTGAKGRVQWKFGGRSCYGALIPRMETGTHCYARTHKGNIKTLAKGKNYWSMLE